ncbi:MAG: Alpha/beta hydrolase fold-3 domain protein [Mycobacterium sp.]|nr:Alpha/beta hydrolase fold-3 domain protein [Mycobacterium sp.]
MSILSLPVVADTVVRVFAATIRPAPKPPVRFDDVPSHTSRVTIPTRYGPTPATIYYPPSGGRARRCTSTSMVAGSLSGTPSRTTHGVDTWPLEPASWW